MGKTDMTAILGSECPACGSNEFEKRGEQRCYFQLDQEFNADGWNTGEIAVDQFSDGEEIIYCLGCEGEWRENEIGRENV